MPDPNREKIVSKLREQAYNDANILPHELIFAMWEAYCENRPEKMNEIQARRLEIKKRFPKE